jgi:hypothetical protein
MNEKSKIAIGVIFLLIIITLPFVYNLAVGGSAPRPTLEMPVGHTQCVEQKEYMTAQHMDLLDEWRDAVVRDGEKIHTSEAHGTTHEMSLTRTCMDCHTSKENFCDRCHAYADVDPYCWDCHLASKGGMNNER